MVNFRLLVFQDAEKRRRMLDSSFWFLCLIEPNKRTIVLTKGDGKMIKSFQKSFLFLIIKGKRNSSKEAPESDHPQNSEQIIIKEFKAPSGGNKRKNKIIYVCLFIILFGFPLWAGITAFKNSDANIRLTIVISIINIIIISPVFILVYFLSKKINQKLYEPFTITLLENGIIVKMGAFIPGLKFDRQEFKLAKETYFGLKVSAGIGKRVTIPKDTEGYEELKAKLLEWVNPTIHGHGDSISSH
jgi:hypothetical protein